MSPANVLECSTRSEDTLCRLGAPHAAQSRVRVIHSLTEKGTTTPNLLGDSSAHAGFESAYRLPHELSGTHSRVFIVANRCRAQGTNPRQADMTRQPLVCVVLLHTFSCISAENFVLDYFFIGLHVFPQEA